MQNVSVSTPELNERKIFRRNFESPLASGPLRFNGSNFVPNSDRKPQYQGMEVVPPPSGWRNESGHSFVKQGYSNKQLPMVPENNIWYPPVEMQIPTNLGPGTSRMQSMSGSDRYFQQGQFTGRSNINVPNEPERYFKQGQFTATSSNVNIPNESERYIPHQFTASVSNVNVPNESKRFLKQRQFVPTSTNVSVTQKNSCKNVNMDTSVSNSSRDPQQISVLRENNARVSVFPENNARYSTVNGVQNASYVRPSTSSVSSITHSDRLQVQGQFFSATTLNKSNNGYSSSNMEPLMSNTGDSGNGTNARDFKPFGTRPLEQQFLFTGPVRNVIQWNKMLSKHSCFFEIIGTVVSLREGNVRTQKIMLLRDRGGPILQVVYYTTTYMAIEDFDLGNMVRCVGKMTGYNIFNAFSIRDASQEEIDFLSRLTSISDQAVNLLLKQ